MFPDRNILRPVTQQVERPHTIKLYVTYKILK